MELWPRNIPRVQEKRQIKKQTQEYKKKKTIKKQNQQYKKKKTNKKQNQDYKKKKTNKKATTNRWTNYMSGKENHGLLAHFWRTYAIGDPI